MRTGCAVGSIAASADSSVAIDREPYTDASIRNPAIKETRAEMRHDQVEISGAPACPCLAP